MKMNELQMNEEEPKNLLSHKTNCYPDSEEISRFPRLLYRIHEKPPFYLSIMLGFQHYLTMFGSTMGMPLILAPIVCFDNEPVVIVSVMSTTFFCSGIVTLLQTSIGCRLPIVQGGTYTFVASIMAIMASKGDCPSKMNANFNMTSNMTNTDPEWKLRMREVQGAIIVASFLQIFIGLSGIIGYVLKYIGPLTIAPTICLVALPLYSTAGYYAGSQWFVAMLTMFCIILFSQVLKKYSLPLCKTRIHIFELFPVLFAMIVGWILSYILTATGLLKKDSPARTDYRSNVFAHTEWFRVPYPGQWGAPSISAAAVFGMLSGVLASMVESIGDYYACARMSDAPPPPNHAINRGLLVEGIGCVITGIWGTGNGTTSYSENIGAIGITRVASVTVIQCGAVIMILLSVIGKFGAIFASIPHPVIGGMFIIMFGMVFAFGISSLQFVDLNSMRNLCVLGCSFYFGMALPSWVKVHGHSINIGVEWLNQVIRVLLMTNMAVGGLTGFVLDNLLPGTSQERGIIKWQNNLMPDGHPVTISSIHVYDPPFLTMKFMTSKVCKYIPFLPYYGDQNLLEQDEGL
ncbi:solute carrier family 23 member 2 isoform X1 [Hydra vulgaris]|uniref:solute carrier family 23 member 2 isoform X1 n=1 Tax=Hydra vulgaris TaxID=6087 RepID=UPI001F5FE287|nr:solute carrier family 23 member 2 [Hydra vulgaris]